MNVLTYVLIGLGAWTAVSIVAGLGIGAVLRHGRAADEFVPVPVSMPLQFPRAA